MLTEMLLITTLIGIAIAFVLCKGGMLSDEPPECGIIESKDLGAIHKEFEEKYKPQGWRKAETKLSWNVEQDDWTFKTMLERN